MEEWLDEDKHLGTPGAMPANALLLSCSLALLLSCSLALVFFAVLSCSRALVLFGVCVFLRLFSPASTMHAVPRNAVRQCNTVQ